MLKINKAEFDNYINLTKEIALSDFKLKYQGSFLGILWALIKPLLTFAVFYIVFSTFIKMSIKNYALYLLLGIMLWNFFSDATTNALLALQQKSLIIKKIAFPRSVVVVSSTIVAVINFLLTVLVFIFLFIVSGMSFHWTNLLIIIFLIELYVISLGMGLLISALSTKLKDLQHIWEVSLKLGFWLTPIVYSINVVPQKFHYLVYLNPLTRVIQYSRESLLMNKVPNYDGMVALFLMTIAIFSIGLYAFNKRSPFFAEEL